VDENESYRIQMKMEGTETPKFFEGTERVQLNPGRAKQPADFSESVAVE
jgi:hypothetical protein